MELRDGEESEVMAIAIIDRFIIVTSNILLEVSVSILLLLCNFQITCVISNKDGKVCDRTMPSDFHSHPLSLPLSLSLSFFFLSVAFSLLPPSSSPSFYTHREVKERKRAKERK